MEKSNTTVQGWKMQVRKKTSTNVQRRKVQVRKNEVRLSWGGKCKYK